MLVFSVPMAPDSSVNVRFSVLWFFGGFCSIEECLTKKTSESRDDLGELLRSSLKTFEVLMRANEYKRLTLTFGQRNRVLVRNFP